MIMKGKGFKVQGSDISLSKNIERLKKNSLEKFGYQNNWNNINKKLISCLNEN